MRHSLEFRLAPKPASRADEGGDGSSDATERPIAATLFGYPGPLERLYARHTSIATGREDGDSRLVHLAIIQRLGANRRIADAEGWTSLALQRVGGTGRLQMWGMPATAERREVVPDWAPR